MNDFFYPPAEIPEVSPPTQADTDMGEVYRLRGRVKELEDQLGEPGYVDALRTACAEVAGVLPRPPVAHEFDQVESLPDWVKWALDALRAERDAAQTKARVTESIACGFAFDVGREVVAAQSSNDWELAMYLQQRDAARAEVAELKKALESLSYEHAQCADALDEAINLETEACAKVATDYDPEDLDCSVADGIAAKIRERAL